VSVVEWRPLRQTLPALLRAAGSGEIELAPVANRTAIIRRMAHSPLKLLTPRGNGPSAHVVTSTYGGGLLAGDAITLRLRAGNGTQCVLGTQASTKVYGGGDDTSRQSLEADIGEGATLAVAPDPVTCFAGSRYEQRQTFRLAATGSLLLIDWMTSGRAARGERWAFRRYRNDTRIDVDGSCSARDATLLEIDGATTVAERMGRFDCIASVFLLGPLFRTAAASLLESIGKTAVVRRSPLVASASPLRDGAVLRVAGGAAEQVGRFISHCLGPAWTALGDNPWTRKW
jgi:urease accessory protein